MKTVALDVHAELPQLNVISEHGELILGMQVPTKPDDLRRMVSGVPGSERVVLEHGPMSGMIHEALKDLAAEIVSADPTRNALIARSENSSDERDAVHLGILDRAGALHRVYVPAQPYRTFRSIGEHDPDKATSDRPSARSTPFVTLRLPGPRQ